MHSSLQAVEYSGKPMIVGVKSKQKVQRGQRQLSATTYHPLHSVLVQMKGFTKLEDSGRARGPIQELISIWGLSNGRRTINTLGGRDTAANQYSNEQTVSTQEQEVLPSHKPRSKRKVTSSYRLQRGKTDPTSTLSGRDLRLLIY